MVEISFPRPTPESRGRDVRLRGREGRRKKDNSMFIKFPFNIYRLSLAAFSFDFIFFLELCNFLTALTDRVFTFVYPIKWGFPGDSVAKNLLATAGGMGFISGSGRSPGEGHCNPLQYSCLGSPMDRGACQAIVHGITKKSWTRLSN